MIVVTAPTGQIGRQVVAALLHGDGEEGMRVVVRDPERLAAEVRDRVEVVVGSHSDREVVERAFEGADAVFWLVPADRQSRSIFEAYVGFSIPAADAIVRLSVPRVVTVSALGRGLQGFAGNVSGTLAMDDLLRRTGTHTRELANPSFMDNLLRQGALIRDEGVFRGTLPADLKLPLIATKDIAAAAVSWLRDHTWTGQEAVDLLGPEDLSGNDIAAILTEVLGRPVRYERGDRGEDQRNLARLGISEPIAHALVSMDAAKERGLDLAVARTPLNTTPTTLRRWATEVLRPAVAPPG